MPRAVECFYPGSSFPAVSITGNRCALNCKHCSKKYLEGMIPATTPEELISVADALAERGAHGFLLSGGADVSGRVGLAEYAPAIEQIKTTTSLSINAHIGLSTRDEIERLVKSGVDSFSVDVYGSDDTIREVIGTGASADDYFEVAQNLKRAGAKRLAPHICIGVHGGKVKGEFETIARLQKLAPPVLVLISLIPTKGTPYSTVKAPDAETVRSVIVRAKEELPDTRLLLGCMRSKRERASEASFVEAGLDGIVLPSLRTVDELVSKGYTVKKRSVCCSLI